MACLLRGVVIGLLFGLPVGAIGALTVQRSWSMGVKAGLLTGLGSSAADCFYACIGVFGLTVLSDFLLRWQTVLTAAGGLLILAMGLKHLFRPQETDPGQQRPVAGAKLFLTSFVIGLTNPAAILTFLFAFSYFGLSQMRGMAEGGLLVGGVFLGTYFWWSFLSALTQVVKQSASGFPLRIVNRLFGGVLCAFGAAVLLRLAL